MLVELELLCREINIRGFAEAELPGKLFLNVCPVTLNRPDYRPGFTRRFLQRIGLRPSDVVIEVAEHHPVDDYGLVREALSHYRGMGFAVAIDDLGAGYASLRLWSELRPEYVKFDRPFIAGINRDEGRQQFVRSLQEIARSVGSRTVAEGIETAGELAEVRELGVDFGQGFHFGRPHLASPPKKKSEMTAA